MVPEVCMLPNESVFQMETQFNFSEESSDYIKKLLIFFGTFHQDYGLQYYLKSDDIIVNGS